MFGGYTGCGTEPGATIVSGEGHSGSSVLTIKGMSNVDLYQFEITQGSENSDGHGGGIDFAGNGTLSIGQTLIHDNSAGYGAGLNVSPNGPAVVTIGSGTIIANNTADHDGGGIHIEGDTRLFMSDSQTVVFLNHADDGRGGGIDIDGPARADIGSPGNTGFGVVSLNSAKYGGGIFVHEGGAVRLFPTDPANPPHIDGNTATQSGGGVFLGASGSGFGTLCAFGYGIDGNTAANGAAIYADSVDGKGGQALLTLGDRDGGQVCAAHESALALGAVPCAVGAPCNTMSGNTAMQDDAAVILIGGHGAVEADQVELRHNTAGHILHAGEVLGSANWSSCLMADNTLGKDVMRLDNGGDLRIDGCTITHNDIAEVNGIFPPLLYVTGDVVLGRTILWQPRTHSLLPGPFDGGGQVTVRDVFCADISIVNSVDADRCEPFGNPGFVNEAAGDYHLRPDSFAVDRTDFAVAIDLEGNPHGVQLFPHRQPSDIGAYELQSVPPGTCGVFDGIFCHGFEK